MNTLKEVINMRSNLLKLLLLMSIFLMPLQVYAEGPKIERAWLGVYEYNGTFYDPLGNTFDVEGDHPVWDYTYTVINYQLDNGEIIRQIIKVNNREMTLEPVNTGVESWTDENGTIHQINRNLPYETEIPVGSQIDIRAGYHMYNDNVYGTGWWIINISENGINFDAIEKSTGYSNTSFVLQNLNRSSTWDILVSSKDTDRIRYSGIIPFNGSNATIYDIRDYDSPAGTGWNYTCAPPENFFKSSSNPGGSTSVRVPIPLGAVIIAIGVMLFISYKRIE